MPELSITLQHANVTVSRHAPSVLQHTTTPVLCVRAIVTSRQRKAINELTKAHPSVRLCNVTYSLPSFLVKPA
jgi:hypothetical protein